MRLERTGLWAHHDFLNLWAGQVASTFGTLIGGLALSFTAVIWLDAGAAEVAILSLCQVVPPFLAGPFAGVWVDRVHRRPVMIAADIGRALALATVPLAALFGALHIWQLYAVTVVTSVLTVLFTVAYDAHMPAVVGRERLVEGNSKMSASLSVVEIGSFGVAGWLVQLLTAPGAIAIDAVSFAWSALFLRRIRSEEPPPPPASEREHVLREAVSGVRAVLGHQVLGALLAATLLLECASRMISVLLLIYLVDDVGFEPGILGMIFAVGGLTSLGGAWAAGRGWAHRRLRLALPVSLLVRAVGALCTPLAASVSPLGVALLVASQVITDPAWTFYEIHETSLRQRLTSDELLGRVNATMRFAGFGAALLGTGVAALVGELAGAREGLFATAAITAAAGLVLAGLLARRPALPLAVAPAAR